MTEFEIATLAFQEATVAFQEGTLAFQKATLGFQESALGFQESALRLQESTLRLQEATLAVRRTGLWIAGAHVAATVVIGLGQIAVVAWGIRVMQRASDQRSRDAREEASHLAQADERRHAEAMRALDMQRQALETLIARTAPAGR